jgi:hypothetical protein
MLLWIGTSGWLAQSTRNAHWFSGVGEGLADGAAWSLFVDVFDEPGVDAVLRRPARVALRRREPAGHAAHPRRATGPPVLDAAGDDRRA